MDEPLASLDDARKAEILPYIERLRDETKDPDRLCQPFGRRGGAARDRHGRARCRQGRGLRPDGRDPAAARPVAGGRARRRRRDARHAGRRPRPGFRHGHACLGRPAKSRSPVSTREVGRHVRVRIRARDVLVATERPRGISALNILPGTVLAHRRGRRPVRRRPDRLQRTDHHRPHHQAFGQPARPCARPPGLRRREVGHVRPHQHRAALRTRREGDGELGRRADAASAQAQ